ncbi:MAG: hypothetical protein HQL07_11735 [Nitrospirae bacterium]|nr:hypothetical protein [Magnetococcales bacterium]
MMSKIMNKCLNLIIFLTLFFAVIPPTSAQDSSLSPSLWMGGKKTILAANPQNGATQITIPNLEPIRDVAVDSRRGVVWAVGNEKFYAFRTDGTPIFSRALPLFASAGDQDDDADDDDSGKSEEDSLAFHRRPQLIVDEEIGNVWITSGNLLQLFDSTGKVLFERKLSDPIQAIAWDTLRARLWVAVRGSQTLRVYDRNGNVATAFDPLGKRKIVDIAYDRDTDLLWVSLGQREIHAYNGSGQQRFAKDFSKKERRVIRKLTPDGLGGVWYSENNRIYHLLTDGRELPAIAPFSPPSGRVRDLMLDPKDKTLWAAAFQGVIQIAGDGNVVKRFEYLQKPAKNRPIQNIRAIAFYLPGSSLAIRSPVAGSVVASRTPTVVLDVTGNINPASITFTVLGTTTPATCTTLTGQLSCTPGQPLPEGAVTLIVTAIDPSGKPLATASVPLTIDTLLPVISLTAPQDGLLTSSTVQMMRGNLDAPATLTIQGQTISINTDLSFSSPLTLNEGTNTITLVAVDSAGNRTQQAITITLDTQPPSLTVLTPINNSTTNQKRPTLTIHTTDSDLQTLAFVLHGNPWIVACQTQTDGATCTPQGDLADGTHPISATISDAAGNTTTTTPLTFTVDTVPPVITLSSPQNPLLTNQAMQTLQGSVNEAGTLTLNDQPVAIDPNNAFAIPVTLNEGDNTFTLKAVDLAGNASTLTLPAQKDSQPPATADGSKILVGDPVAGQVTISGAPACVEANTRVVISLRRLGSQVNVDASATGTFSAVINAVAGDILEIAVVDAAGNTSSAIAVAVSNLPPDPVVVAPPVSTGTSTNLSSSISFLYSGDNPIQTDVAPNAIEPKRVAVVRGSVVDKTGVPVTGVSIGVVNTPQLGKTVSRADGNLDLAVNGGSWVTVSYEKEGYLPVHRQVKAGHNQ